MSVTSTHLFIQNAIMHEAERIYQELYELYLAKTIVNKPFYRLVEERVNPKYHYYEQTILIKVEALIPKNLYISFDHKYVFYEEQEYFHLSKQIREEKFLESISDQPALDCLAKQVATDIIDQYGAAVDSYDIFDLFTPALVPDDYNEQEYQYLVNQIASQIECLLSSTSHG